MGEEGEPGKLASATRSSLQLAQQHGLASIALPAISTGVFGYPLDACAQTMLRVIIDFTFEQPTALKQIIMCLYDDHAYRVFEAELKRQIDALDRPA